MAGGGKLKSKAPGWDGTDDFGFSAMPGGLRFNLKPGDFEDIGAWGGWWSATENGSTLAYRWRMNTGRDYLSGDPSGKNIGISVRCVQRSPEPAWVPPKIEYGTISIGDKEYRTVTINGKTWLAENLSVIPASNTAKKNTWCYGDDESNCKKYGRLYSWDAAMAACPAGWRLPGREDWRDFVGVAGDQKSGGGRLKSKAPGWDGTDDLGFSAVPGGRRDADGGRFLDIGSSGYWWTSAANSEESAISWRMETGVNNIYESTSYKKYGLSVRCVRD
jgi:uncharacterized protein (TIGR02145 family)